METNLYPLTDFSPHKERDDIEECYLYGRYGGKPIIDEFRIPIQEILKYEEFIDVVNQSRRPTNRSLVRKGQK